MSIYDTVYEEGWENLKECFRKTRLAIDKRKAEIDSQSSNFLNSTSKSRSNLSSIDDELRKALEEASYNSSCTNTEERKMTRSEILQKAKTVVTGERQQNYGTPEDNFKRVASLWNAYKGDNLFDAVDVAMMMALLKIARISTGTQTEDSFIDLAGYAACGGEIALGEEKR